MHSSKRKKIGAQSREYHFYKGLWKIMGQNGNFHTLKSPWKKGIFYSLHPLLMKQADSQMFWYFLQKLSANDAETISMDIGLTTNKYIQKTCFFGINSSAACASDLSHFLRFEDIFRIRRRGVWFQTIARFGIHASVI